MSDCSTAVDYCYKVGFVPQTYEEAKNCENADGWSKAMDDEINSRIENQTFVITEIPASKMLLKENGFIQANWKLTVKLNARQDM